MGNRLQNVSGWGYSSGVEHLTAEHEWCSPAQHKPTVALSRFFVPVFPIPGMRMPQRVCAAHMAYDSTTSVFMWLKCVCKQCGRVGTNLSETPTRRGSEVLG